jgi:hypothetical protein
VACFEIKLIRISRKRSLDYHPAMIGLTDSQLKIIMTAANTVPVERRDIFLQRVGAMLSMRHRFSDTDVVDVTTLAIAGLIQTAETANAPAATARAMQWYLWGT